MRVVRLLLIERLTVHAAVCFDYACGFRWNDKFVNTDDRCSSHGRYFIQMETAGFVLQREAAGHC